MFALATEFNQNLAKWSTRFAQDMAKMFAGAEKFNSDISGWDVTHVSTFEGTFYADTENGETSSFDIDLSPWDIRNAMNIKEMLRGSNIHSKKASVLYHPNKYPKLICGPSWVTSQAYAYKMCPATMNPCIGKKQ